MNYAYVKKNDYLMHYGVKGMKWRNRKNRPLSREERVTEGNGHVYAYGYGQATPDYNPSGRHIYFYNNEYGQNIKNRPLSRKERYEVDEFGVVKGNGKVYKSPTFNQAVKASDKREEIAKSRRAKSRKKFYSLEGNGDVYAHGHGLNEDRNAKRNGNVSKGKKVQFGNSAGVRKRKKIYGYKRKQRMGLIRTM